MTNGPYFPILESEIAKRGIRKKDIAEAIGIEPKSISNKLTGKTELKLNEMRVIQAFIPDIPLDQLFSHETNV